MTDREQIQIPSLDDWGAMTLLNVHTMIDALVHTLSDLTTGVLIHQDIPEWDQSTVDTFVEKLRDASGAGDDDEMSAYAEAVRLYRDLSNWYCTKVLGEFVNAGLLPFDAETVQIPDTVPEDFS